MFLTVVATLLFIVEKYQKNHCQRKICYVIYKKQSNDSEDKMIKKVKCRIA